MQMMNGNIRRLAMRPAWNVPRNAAAATVGQEQPVLPQQQAAAAGGDHAMMLATLMPTPRSIHDLWQEYQHGGGSWWEKSREVFLRGRSNHRYHRRKVVWDLIAGLVRQGHTADTGRDRIYAVYAGGQTSVTNIINGLKRDKK
jgi:Transcriptional activator of glycolytic enzymes